MYCSNCGKELPDGSSFCPTCGADQSRASVCELQGKTKRSWLVPAAVIVVLCLLLGAFFVWPRLSQDKTEMGLEAEQSVQELHQTDTFIEADAQQETSGAEEIVDPSEEEQEPMPQPLKLPEWCAGSYYGDDIYSQIDFYSTNSEEAFFHVFIYRFADIDNCVGAPIDENRLAFHGELRGVDTTISGELELLSEGGILLTITESTWDYFPAGEQMTFYYDYTDMLFPEEGTTNETGLCGVYFAQQEPWVSLCIWEDADRESLHVRIAERQSIMFETDIPISSIGWAEDEEAQRLDADVYITGYDDAGNLAHMECTLNPDHNGLNSIYLYMQWQNTPDEYAVWMRQRVIPA